MFKVIKIKKSFLVPVELVQKKVAEKTKCGQIKKRKKKGRFRIPYCTYFLELKENRFVLKEIDTHTDQIQSQWILICKLNTASRFKSLIKQEFIFERLWNADAITLDVL